jgi:1,4-alpha-glucan branching enzyme
LVRDCNRLYRAEAALHARDCEGEGFRWIVVDDRDNSVFAWLRDRGDGQRPIAMIANFTPVARPGYRVGLPLPGRWREILNTDAGLYGGSDCGNAGGVDADDTPRHGYPCSADVTLPPLGTVWLVHDGGQ